MTTPRGKGAGRAAFGLLPLALCLGAAGCTWDQLNPFHVNEPDQAAAKDGKDSVVLRPDGLGKATPSTAELNADLEAARELFRQRDYVKAEKACHKIAEKAKDDPVVAEEARFYEAECLYMQGHYPKSADTYMRMLNEHGSGLHREQAVQRMFDIANYWLEDTRQEMEQAKEKQAGKRWFSTPHFVHLEKTKPFLDEEGRALELLEHVRYNDISGPLADKALFMIGTVRFYNEDYREADYQFTQIVEKHPTSQLYPRAVEMAIISKNLCTGGSDYDGRKCAEARDMVPIALASYSKMEQADPQLAKDKEEFLRRQLAGITMQQAEKDYKTAEFYRRTGRPESAFFLYEVVRRRYPGTKYADLATEQMHQIRAKVEKENGARLAVPEAAPLQPDAALFYRQVPGAPAAVPAAGDGGNAFGSPPRPLPPSIQQ